MKQTSYEEYLTDWVLQFGHTDSPSDSQFSATDVAHIIMKYNRDKLSGKLNTLS